MQIFYRVSTIYGNISATNWSDFIKLQNRVASSHLGLKKKTSEGKSFK